MKPYEVYDIKKMKELDCCDLDASDKIKIDAKDKFDPLLDL